MLIIGRFGLLSTPKDAVALEDCPRKFVSVSEIWYVVPSAKSWIFLAVSKLLSEAIKSCLIEMASWRKLFFEIKTDHVKEL